MQEKIIILDFGSQYTQLIARRLRELNTYCEILPSLPIPGNMVVPIWLGMMRTIPSCAVCGRIPPYGCRMAILLR